jgi:hypothetical protein
METSLRAPRKRKGTGIQRVWELTRYNAGGFSMEWNRDEREWQLMLPPYEGKRGLLARGPDADGVIDHALTWLERNRG